MVKYLVIIFFSLCSLVSFSQSDTTCHSRSPLPEAGVKATIKGYRFTNELDVRRSFFRKNFSLALSDSTYEIVGFEFYYTSEDGVAYHGTVCDENIFTAKYPVFSYLKEGGFFQFTNITIEKAGIKFHTPSFLVFPVD
jgi:hypothetical protein